MITRIYLLRDPRDQAVRYVGATRKKLSTRLRHHIASASTALEYNKAPRYAWLRELIAESLRPDIEELEVVDENDKATAEQRWIDHYHQLGCDLLNRKPGGGGPSTSVTRRPWTADQRKRASEETARRYREDPALRKRVSEGTRTAMVEFLSENGEEYGRKISAAVRRRYEDPEARRKTGERTKEMWANRTPEERAHHTEAMRAAVAREPRVKCPSCDMVSRPANITRHRKARGH